MRSSALIGEARDHGATLHVGGERIGNRGFFYAPSVLSDVPVDAAIMNEEPFGPVALINPFADEEAMIAEANRLPYGLAAICLDERCPAPAGGSHTRSKAA